jgi:hypothetical protein
MGIGVSLILVAFGAILTWAVTAEVSGVDLNTGGVILMVGIVGALLRSSSGPLGAFAATTARPSWDRDLVER